MAKIKKELTPGKTGQRVYMFVVDALCVNGVPSNQNDICM
jgi:hypothetical protein